MVSRNFYLSVSLLNCSWFTMWCWFHVYSTVLHIYILFRFFSLISSVQFSHSVMPTLCDFVDYSTPGLPVHHQLPYLAQTYVHRVGDAIQPSHPLLSPFPLAFNLSQHQSLFQWVSSSHLACEHCLRCNQHYHQPEATSPEAQLLWCFCLFSEVFLQQWGMFSVICGTMSIYIFIYILDWMK